MLSIPHHSRLNCSANQDRQEGHPVSACITAKAANAFCPYSEMHKHTPPDFGLAQKPNARPAPSSRNKILAKRVLAMPPAAWMMASLHPLLRRRAGEYLIVSVENVSFSACFSPRKASPCIVSPSVSVPSLLAFSAAGLAERVTTVYSANMPLHPAKVPACLWRGRQV